MKPENKLIRRRDEFIELCKELNYPFVIAYCHTFDMKSEPLVIYVHGAGRKPDDVKTLLECLEGSARRCLFISIEHKEPTEFTDSCSLRVGDRPGPPILEDCGS